MFQHKTHAAITNALSKAPRRVVCDVALDPITGFLTITDRTSKAGSRYYSEEELTSRNGEGFVGEGRTYKHIYFCSDEVPASVRDALSS